MQFGASHARGGGRTRKRRDPARAGNRRQRDDLFVPLSQRVPSAAHAWICSCSTPATRARRHFKSRRSFVTLPICPMITEVQQRGRARTLAETSTRASSSADPYALAELGAARNTNGIDRLARRRGEYHEAVSPTRSATPIPSICSGTAHELHDQAPHEVHVTPRTSPIRAWSRISCRARPRASGRRRSRSACHPNR